MLGGRNLLVFLSSLNSMISLLYYPLTLPYHPGHLARKLCLSPASTPKPSHLSCHQSFGLLNGMMPTSIHPQHFFTREFSSGFHIMRCPSQPFAFDCGYYARECDEDSSYLLNNTLLNTWFSKIIHVFDLVRTR